MSHPICDPAHRHSQNTWLIICLATFSRLTRAAGASGQLAHAKTGARQLFQPFPSLEEVRP